MINEYGAIGWMKIDRGNQSTGRKPTIASLCLPQVSHDLTWDWTWAAVVGSQWPADWSVLQIWNISFQTKIFHIYYIFYISSIIPIHTMVNCSLQILLCFFFQDHYVSGELSTDWEEVINLTLNENDNKYLLEMKVLISENIMVHGYIMLNKKLCTLGMVYKNWRVQ
jgi:hypothetical protein